LKFSKNVNNNKKHAPKLIFFNEKKIEKDSDPNFWHRKFTLKVKNWFRADIDQTWIFFYEKSVIFHSIKLSFDAEVDEKFLNVIYYPWINPSLECLSHHILYRKWPRFYGSTPLNNAIAMWDSIRWSVLTLTPTYLCTYPSWHKKFTLGTIHILCYHIRWLFLIPSPI
jgi:hypothetical protein